jgi:hypothetical protein
MIAGTGPRRKRPYLPCPYCRRARSACWVMPCLGLERLLARKETQSGEARLAQWVRGGGFILTRKDGRHIKGNPIEWEQRAIAYYAAEK